MLLLDEQSINTFCLSSGVAVSLSSCVRLPARARSYVRTRLCIFFDDLTTNPMTPLASSSPSMDGLIDGVDGGLKSA